MERGKRYLMGSFGGQVFDTDFLAQSDQAVPEIPADFDLSSLAGKAAAEKAQRIFDARRAEMDRQLDRLQREKDRLAPTKIK